MTPGKIWSLIRKNIFIISAIVSLVGGAVYLIDRFKLDSKISNMVVTFVNGIINLKIPDFILVIILITIIIILVKANKKFRELSPAEIKKMKADNEKIKKHNKELIEAANGVISYNKELQVDIEALKEKNKDNRNELEKIVKSDLEKFRQKFESIIDNQENRESLREKVKNQNEKDWKILLNEEKQFILTVLGNQPDNYLDREDLFNSYEKEFMDKTRLNFNITVSDLEKEKLIHCGAAFTGEPYFSLSKSGFDVLKKIA